MSYIKFSHDYSKLDYPVFPTIRRYDRYELSEHIQVKTPTKNFPALIISKAFVKLSLLQTEFLCLDTDTKTREEAYKVLNSFYRKPITEEEVLTVLTLMRSSRNIRRNTNMKLSDIPSWLWAGLSLTAMLVMFHQLNTPKMDVYIITVFALGLNTICFMWNFSDILNSEVKEAPT